MIDGVGYVPIPDIVEQEVEVSAGAHEGLEGRVLAHGQRGVLYLGRGVLYLGCTTAFLSCTIGCKIFRYLPLPNLDAAPARVSVPAAVMADVWDGHNRNGSAGASDGSSVWSTGGV